MEERVHVAFAYFLVSRAPTESEIREMNFLYF